MFSYTLLLLQRTRSALVSLTFLHPCPSSLQDLTVPQDFYCPLSVCGTILLTMYLMVWDWPVLRAEPMLFYTPKLRLIPFVFYSFPCFPFPIPHITNPFSLWVGWYCGAGVFGLRECLAFSSSFALSTFFKNNKKKKKNTNNINNILSTSQNEIHHKYYNQLLDS